MAGGFGTTFFGRWTALFVALFLGVPPFANSVANAIADDGPSPGVPAACVTPIGDTSLADDSVPAPECPDVVVSLTVTPGLNSALVSWQPPANAAAAQVTAYVIDVRSQSRVVTVAATETSATITGLVNGLEVDFAVHAVSSLGAGPASATVTTTPTTGVEGEVAGFIVKFTSDVAVGDTIEFVGPLDTSIELPVVDEVAGDVVLVELPDSISVDDAEAIADEIADEPGVEWVEPDRFVFVAETGVDGSSTPNDTQWSSSQWNLWDRFGVGVADGNTAVADGWSRGSGEGSVVAVIDTGITSHPDLDQRLVPGYDFVSDPAELAATRVSGGADVPFDGDYVDPIAFGSLGRDDNPTDPGDWRDVTPVRDSTWHGTAMAGVIAARANDSLGVAGVAPNARVQPVRALSWRGGLLSDIAASITWASGGPVDGVPANATPANVINLSFAVESACPASLQEAIDGAIGSGAVVIAAAGNASSNASMFAPGNCDGVVNVGATGRDGRRAPYSNWGNAVDVSAPGGSTDGTVTTTSNSGVTTPANHSWSTAEGTSVAAAHVAGAVAVLRGANPSLTVEEVVERLTGGDYVKQFGGTTCDGDPSKTCGAGILDLAQIAVSRQGSIDYSMTLNGINQYLSAPDNTAFDVTTAATFSAWLKPTSGCGSGLKTFLRKEGSYALGCIDGTWHWALAGSSGWYNNGWVNTNHRVQYGVWQHVALTFSSNTVKFYVDGQEVSAGSTTGSISNSASVLNVGVEGTIFFPGDIDELRIYSSARTLAEIQSDMHTHGLSTSIPSLQAYFDFNDGTGTTVYNRVSNAASTTHLTAVGSPNFVDVKTTEVSGSDTVVTFGRSYLSSVGGWVVPAGVTTAQILAVGGGGGGGAHVGGGGGGGGFITATSAVPSLQSLKVVVGQGGVGGKLVTACLNPCLSSRQATSGGNSSVIGGSVSLDAVGGGSGGHWDYYAPRSGGSGGGSGNGSVSAGAGTSGQGSAGGIGHTANVNGGGGGGAGGIGGAGTSSNGGSGGLGLSSSISGAAVFYAGGGGGGVHTSGTAGSGGSGVGGTGVVASGTKAGDGVDGRGGGGGGAGRTNASPSEGGDGGSGVVIVRYATASERCTPERTTEGSYTVLAFKDVGTCTWTVPAGVTNVDYLVVGGGGGGGAFVGGGGGAGGLRSGTGLLLRPEQSVSIVVGDGGAGGEVIVGGGAQASNGGTSSISGTGITTVSGTGGGGGGGGGNSGATRDNGSSGGSGGGAVYGGSLSSVGTGVAGEGSNGALGFTRDSAPACYAAGGGGGAGTAGAAGSDCRGGGGGIGAVTTLISATSASRLRVGENVSGSVYLAGGGAGGAFGNAAQPTSAGGSGGGGAGSQAGSGASGLDFTGGGGGGGGAQSDASGGDGGSGVVILRYEVQDIDFAMSFDGSTQFASASAPSLTTDLTIEAWAYPTTPCSSEQFVLFQENRFGVSCSGGTWRLIYKDVSSGGAWVAHDTGTSVSSSQWQHLAVRRVDSTGVITFSLNGQDVFTTTDLDDWAASSDPLFIGKAGNNAKNFAGRVDEVKLWNSTRTQAQIAAGMHARPDVSLANLLAYYDFNEGTGSTVYNRKVGATSSTHLTTTSSPTFVDVKSVDVSSVAGRSIVTFPRSYITAAGGWTVPQGVTSAQYLVVGGGGGGGSRHGGGGGAGGFRTGTASVVAGSVSPVIVGQGGKGVAEVSNAAYNGIAANNGQDSSVLGFTSLGGGRGAAAGGAATSGGSGGGAQMASSFAGHPIGQGTAGQGSNGGQGDGNSGYGGGGGGGAGAVGGNAAGNTGGAGGAGQSSAISGSTVFYAGGGGGGGSTGGSGGAGGNGGGGAGKIGSAAGDNGAPNTGGGGGSGGYDSLNRRGGDGGSGVVIVSYGVPSIGLTTTCTNPSTTEASDGSGDVIVTFTTVQSCTWTPPLGVSSVQALIVGGGGGGGFDGGGGGGGGGVRYQPSTSVIPGVAISVTVGGGGTGAATSYPSTGFRNLTGQSGGNGGNSVFGSVSATGGGGGGGIRVNGAASASGDARGGGGGGGSGHYDFFPNSPDGGSGGAGCSGCTGGSGKWHRGGGGASGVVNAGISAGGTAQGAATGGNGGEGASYAAFGSTVFGSGGGGGDWFQSTNPTVGGTNAGRGGRSDGTLPTTGLANTGGGGGGGGVGNQTGANGGSGVVIIRYTPVDASCTPLTYSSGGFTVVEFQSVGTCTWTVPTGVTAVEVLAVGGGGGGGAHVGGGGGGGGVTETSGVSVTPGSPIDVLVGAGGSGAIATSAFTNGTDGQTSRFGSSTPVVALGGGVGASWSQSAGGGATVATGGGGVSSSRPAGSATGSGSALTGGSSSSDSQPHPTGGGAGAGGNGVGGSGSGSSWAAGAGGPGKISNLTGATLHYGGGGGGSAHGTWPTSTSWNSSVVITPGVGGAGGGGTGGRVVSSAGAVYGADGVDGLGGGGGGSANWGLSTATPSYGGDGGDGTVVVRYAASSTATITYDDNAANETIAVPATQTAAINSSVTVGAAPTRTGHTFAGWNTAAGGTGISYSAGASFTLTADVTLFAQWNVDSYTVTYNDNVANETISVPATQTAAFNSSVTVGAAPTRTGHTFAGWNTVAGGTGTAYAAGVSLTIPASNTVLFAQWTVNNYTITYNDNVANETISVPATQTAAFNSSVTVGAAPTRTGHTFAGWNTAANGTGTALSAGASYTVTATSPTLFAQWTTNSYTVSYNANGGTGAPTTSSVQFGSTATVAAAASNPSRTGHTFASWTTNADGTGSSYAPSATFTMGAANVTLFAKWTVNNYTVSYDDNVISAVITVPSTQSTAYAGSVTVGAAPTRTGFTFAGWNTAANGTGTSYSAGANLTIPASNTVLYAQWNVNSYNVSYNLNGGSGTAPVAQSADFDTSITAASTSSTRTGFTFAGWNTAADGTGSAVAAGAAYTIPAANSTLFAQWTANQYTITFAANDDVANAATGLPGNLTGRTYQQNVTLPSAAPSRPNYVFSGWNTSAAGTGVSYAVGGAYVMPNNNVTLHAQWTPASFGVVYNANGGITPPAPTNNDFGSTVTVSTTRPTRTGHTFRWWTATADGTGTTYRNPALGSTVSTFTMPGSQVTLFAQWEVNSYNLTYDANLGSNAPSGQSIAFNATATASVSAPTRAGYQFNGWNTIADGSGVTYAAGGTFSMPAANVTLYAQWQAITYTVAYNTNGGDGAAPTAQSATTDSSVTVSSTIPTRAGYDFAGWNTQAGGFGTPRTPGGTFAMPASNVILFAQWNAQTLSISYNGNGGTGIPTGQSGLVDSSVTISATTPTRTGHTFAGWNTAANGTGTARTSGSTFVMPTAAFVLYAQWQAISYSVSYEANNGTGAPSASSHTYLDTVTLSATAPTRAGYWFNGWNSAADGSGMAHTSGGNLTMPAANVTLYAQWVADLYRVVYNANGGEDAPAEQVLATDSSVSVSSQVPTREGHEFRHWTTTQNGTGSTYTNPATDSAVDNFTMPPSNTTLFAQWSVSSYVLSYDANLGAGAPSGGATQFGTSVTVSSTVPTRTGHSFTGWNTAANGSGVSYVAGNTLSMPANPVTLYAQWSAKTYSITYFANGGSSAPVAQSVTYGSTTSVSVTPATRSGYTFTGWNTQANGQGVARSSGGSLVMPDSNVDLYAQWSAQTFDVSFDANGGTSAPSTVSGTTDSSVTLPVGIPTRVGFDFVGWNTLQAGTGTGYQAGSSLVMPPNNMVLWAQWQPRTYVLSYDMNGGTTNPPIGALASTSSSVQAAVSTPIRLGYTFTGWNTRANGQGIAASSGASFSMPPNDTTLYAQWAAQTFIVTYDANGGSGGPSQQNATTDSSVTVSSVVPTRSGFTFAGWNTTIGGTGTSYSSSASFTMPPDNVALWAQWTANPTPPAPQLPPAPQVLTPPAAPTIPSGRSTTLSPLAEAPPAGDEWDRPTMGVFAIDSVSFQDVRTAQSSSANARVSRLETSAGVWSTDTQSGTVSFVARSTFSGQARVGFAVTTRRGVEYTSVLTVNVTRPVTLPVSGSESSTPLTLAVWVLVAGILVSALVRRRTILR